MRKIDIHEVGRNLNIRRTGTKKTIFRLNVQVDFLGEGKLYYCQI